MKKFVLMFSALTAIFSLMFLQPIMVGAIDLNPEICKGLSGGEMAGCNPTNLTNQGNKVLDIVNIVINIFSIIVGAVSVIMIIVGGLRYLVSAGDSSAVTGAKNTILYAIVGLVIVIFAQTIVKFILSKLLNSNA